MNKYYAGLAVMATGAFIGTASAQDYGAQIDALQNEVLKMKQEMSKGSGDSKAYFKKGKGPTSPFLKHFQQEEGPMRGPLRIL